jgi:hypothetical protein
MRVPDQVRKCVVFIGYKMADGSFRFAGSGLFFGDDSVEPKYAYIITARHVIDWIREHLLIEVWLRVNTKSGGCEWICTDLSRWICSEDPSLDVAICYGSPTETLDHMILHRHLALTPDIAQTLNVGVGSEVFITGLFANYAGDLRNVPIVRVGNLAAYPEERIPVRGFRQMDAFLIEARSIGGLSGSPVFYHAHGSHLGVFRPFAPAWLSPIPAPQPWAEDDAKARGMISFYLMGIIHGHYNQKAIAENEPDAIRNDIEELNTGIAIVVPVGKILSFIDDDRSKR